MIRINEHYTKLKASYLFSDIARRVATYQQTNPGNPVIRLGIGDVTEPLPPACIDALHAATDELASRATFKGYGPEQGYAFLREAIAANDYAARGCKIDADEIFVSDGSKCDCANIQEIFAANTRIAIPDPVYPVYLDSNIMAGRLENITYLESTPANNYVPAPPVASIIANTGPELIWLCFPNNPTGAVATRQQLSAWVAYARATGAIILYDSAYEAFIRTPGIPRSIYEIPGAREVAIEFRSFSKTAGFTGTRCAYTVIPKTLMARDASGNAHSLHALWLRRQSTKFNGVSYPVQRAAAAIYTDTGKQQTRALADFYLGNAALIRAAMAKLGFVCTGGIDAPYIWVNVQRDSWQFFDHLLTQAQVVCTPGVGFGKCGENHIRISAFNTRENVEQALTRIAAALT